MLSLLIAIETNSDVWNGAKWQRGDILKSKKVILRVKKKILQSSQPGKIASISFFCQFNVVAQLATLF